MSKILVGLDIGGTKCAVSIGQTGKNGVTVMEKEKFPTPESPEAAIQTLIKTLDSLLVKTGIKQIDAIGVSCGSPLDSKKGVILSPPNLPNWDHIDVVTPFQEKYQVPVGLQNDANACALAEWKWGAGSGLSNMIFLTFGTGMGAGLILNGRLYTGTNDMAGEVGHIRLEDDGPVGYGKHGSFEGYCSGGGIGRLGTTMAKQAIEEGNAPAYCQTMDEIDQVSAKTIGEAAQNGDPLALQVYQIVGEKLGKGLAILIDILNPERIVIGSIYGRQQQLLEQVVMDVIKKEALNISSSVCEITPAGLGESVGDLASLSVALNVIDSL